jgi:hypothetical protein
MKTTEQISQDILGSLGQSANPVGVLLEGYLSSVIREIVKDQLIEFQQYLADDDMITSHDWSFEDEANRFLNR